MDTGVAVALISALGAVLVAGIGVLAGTKGVRRSSAVSDAVDELTQAHHHRGLLVTSLSERLDGLERQYAECRQALERQGLL